MDFEGLLKCGKVSAYQYPQGLEICVLSDIDDGIEP